MYQISKRLERIFFLKEKKKKILKWDIKKTDAVFFSVFMKIKYLKGDRMNKVIYERKLK